MQNTEQAIQTEIMPKTRGRGRPRAFDRNAALAKATRLFWQKGYEATSISDLTQTMGIGSPSLYAAFGSKEALYAEALTYYRDTFEELVWGRFMAATTAREAVQGLLEDSAQTLGGARCDIPPGCMVVLSAVGSEGYPELGELVRSARHITFERVKTRIEQDIAAGTLPKTLEADGLARFVQSVQNGMALLSRDGADATELDAVAKVAMQGWDTSTGHPQA